MNAQTAKTDLKAPADAPEVHVQFAIAMVLDELGLLWCHIANEALQRGGLVYGGILVGLGVKTGVPDCLIFDSPPASPTRCGVALELKTRVGRTSPDQRRWLGELEQRNWEAHVEKGTCKALDRLRTLGWPVDDALSRLAARGWVLVGERLVKTKNRSKSA